ncbi:MAG TPA: hypothetical protein VJ043_01830 [Candidatus Paceibacterota bacterium]|nr:hypothetical protein [Candidatus Paceibacterota bacterium]
MEGMKPKSLEQHRDDRNLTPKQVEKYEGSRKRFDAQMGEKAEEKMLKRSGLRNRIGGEPEYAIHENAIFEKHLRDVLKEREIDMSDFDISKIVSLERGADDTEYASGTNRTLHTIDSKARHTTSEDGAREIELESKETGRTRFLMYNDTLEREFLRRYPIDELEPAMIEAKGRADTEIRAEEMKFDTRQRQEAQKTVDDI